VDGGLDRPELVARWRKNRLLARRIRLAKRASPALAVVARRLDAPAPLVSAPHANGVRFNGAGLLPGADMAMMTGFALPTPGCWEIAAHYKDQTLSFVVSVGPYSGSATGSEFPR
jgi:hypothetical protein